MENLGKSFKKYLNFLILLVFSFSISAANDVQLRLPVRVLKIADGSIELKKEDFKLFINGNQRKIVDLIRRKKSLGRKSDLGRDFILSFHLTEYNKHVENGISYFITEILNISDSLYILSPLKIYQIYVSTNKEKTIRTIEEILKKDCEKFKKERTSQEKQLINNINVLKATLSGDALMPNRNLTQRKYKKTSHFLNSFPGEFFNFKKYYLMPNTSIYQKTIDPIVCREGERWWIHFQQKEVISLFSKIDDVIKRMEEYIREEETLNQSLARVLRRGLLDLEKQMMSTDSFPEAQLLNTLVGNNINYNAIFFRSDRNKIMDDKFAASPGLEVILRRISSACGGKTVSTVDTREGIKEIEDHADDYYEIVYDWDGKIEDKKLHVTIDRQKVNLSYRDNVGKEKVESLIRFLSQEKIKIIDVKVDKNILAFSVSEFEHKEKEQYGLLMIRIEMFDELNRSIYKSENTLRASEDSVAISIPITKECSNQSPLKLTITACDLISNRNTAVTHHFNLD
ncbi:hypothetical protein HQ584_00830 [Patescibacteria group bacterium]|nr:hypothetical protein [Patescibacteria group bacterium]